MQLQIVRNKFACRRSKNVHSRAEELFVGVRFESPYTWRTKILPCPRLGMSWHTTGTVVWVVGRLQNSIFIAKPFLRALIITGGQTSRTHLFEFDTAVLRCQINKNLVSIRSHFSLILQTFPLCENSEICKTIRVWPINTHHPSRAVFILSPKKPVVDATTVRRKPLWTWQRGGADGALQSWLPRWPALHLLVLRIYNEGPRNSKL